MRLAVLLLRCSDAEERATFTRDWMDLLMTNAARYFADQSGQRASLQWHVFDWYQLSFDNQRWVDLKGHAGEHVLPEVAANHGVIEANFDKFALVIDHPASTSAAWMSNKFVHVSARDVNPALFCHELGHGFGVGHEANREAPAGPVEYGDPFCVMGSDSFSFVDGTLSLQNAPTRGHIGPGMAPPSLISCRWLDVTAHGVDIGSALRSGGRTTFTLAPLRGAPRGQQVPIPVCAWADGIVDGQRLVVSYRVAEGWDRGVPLAGGARGWVTAHVGGSGLDSSLLVAAAHAAPGAEVYVERGTVRLSVLGEDAQGVRVLAIRENRPVIARTPAVAAWGRGRLDIFGPGLDHGVYHKVWDRDWYPSRSDWLPLGGPEDGGGLFGTPGVASWGPDRLDLFALGAGNSMHHLAWMGQHWQEKWQPLGGIFITPPTVTSWGPGRLDVFALGLHGGAWWKTWDEARGGWDPPNEPDAKWLSLGGCFIGRLAAMSWGPGRLDVFGVGTDSTAYHRAWQGQWRSTDLTGHGVFQGDWAPRDGWEPLGGRFTSPLAVASWGPDRLDIFGVGTDNAMYHKAWEGQERRWYPDQNWHFLGGGFSSPPAVVSWGPNRLDIFGLGLDGGVYHKAWEGGWSPSETEWEPLGGRFTSPPAVASWGRGRLDIFGLGVDNTMYHKAWDAGWDPETDWEPIGGKFA